MDWGGIMLQQVPNIKEWMFNSKKKKIKQLPSFLLRISTLLKEGYTLIESIHMVLPYHTNYFNDWRNVIEEQFRKGADVVDILHCLNVPNPYLVTIKIAEESGTLPNALETIANQLQFAYKMRRKLTKILSYPLCLIVFLTIIFIAFRTYFLPNITMLLSTREGGSHDILSTSTFFLYLPDYLFFAFLIAILTFLLSYFIIKRRPIKQQLNMIMKIPLINYVYKLNLTNQLSKTIGNLLLGGFTLQQALKIIENQKLNPTLSFIANDLEMKVIYGESLSGAVSMSNWFASEFKSFIKHGESSGYLGRELLIYCELIEERIQTLIKTTISILQPLLFILIAICIVGAYISILLPMYEIIEII